jgi:hypothetical protein
VSSIITLRLILGPYVIYTGFPNLFYEDVRLADRTSRQERKGSSKDGAWGAMKKVKKQQKGKKFKKKWLVVMGAAMKEIHPFI